MFSWFANLDEKIQVALIGIIAGMLTILIKDVAVHLWLENRQRRRSALAVYRNYADPIASAASHLFWRLKETLTGRGEYLKKSGAETRFDKYKYDSTLFRLATLIGWLRAYRRELTLFSLDDPEKLSDLNKAINRFEEALAEGAHVETQRVRSLAQLWEISLPKDDTEISTLGFEVEKILKSALHSGELDREIDLASDLPLKKQIALCESIANSLTRNLNINNLCRSTIKKKVKQSIRSLSIREAWLYRDFQSGIGDLMIRNTEGGARRFEIIGFGEFEDLINSPNEAEKRWVGRLNRIIDRLDISGADQFDARVRLLEDILLATIDLLLTLNRIDVKRGIVTERTLRESNSLRRNRSWRKSGNSN